MARSRTLNIVVAGDDDKATKMWRRQSQEVDKYGKQVRLTTSVTSNGFHGMRAAATGAAAGIGGAIIAAKSFVDAASDINESLTKNRALFGQYAAGIEAYAKDTAASLGISRREALAAAGTFGGLFDAIDIGQKKSAGMSKRLVTLAADLASFNNASPEEALEALRSGLAGEAEPMRKFNAFLSETRVQAEAASMGLGKVHGDVDKLKAAHLTAEVAQQRYNVAVQRYGKESAEAKSAQVSMINAQERLTKAGEGGTVALTEAQKVQARYNLILKDTKASQGDATKTGDGYANQTRRLSAQIDDLKATIGEKLLPTVTRGVRGLNKFVGEMQDGTGQGGRFVDTLKDIWGEVEPVVKWVGRATKNIAEFAAQHPKVTKLAAEVAGVGLAIKGLRTASAAVGFTDLLKAGRAVMRRLVALFAAQGAAAGTAAGASAAGAEGFGSSAVNSLIRKTGGKSGRILGRSMGVGIIAGLALTIPEITDRLYKMLGAKKGTSTGFGEAILKSLFGDGPGKRPASSKGSKSLMGARSSLQPFANIGAGYGLSVTSGARPGSITSSGNVSYHSTGEAIDMGDGRGPDANKLRFFRDLKSRYGSRLAELIYTPGGTGIKNGRPFKYTGQVAADHYDHVHVAIDSGKAGVGDGLGKGSIMNLWTRAGGSANVANLAAAVAMAESGGNTDAKNVNSNGSIDRGLWQINSIHGARSTFDPLGNARAAVSISSGGSNWRPWVAYNTGAYKRFLTGGSSASPTVSADSLQNRVDANQRRIDTLRDQLDRVPKGIAGAVQRDRIQAQIRGIQSQQRSLRSDLRDAPSAADLTERAERAGSRLVNRIVAPFQKGLRAASKGAAALGTQIEDADTAYGQTERLFGQTDEDLGTLAGRKRRVSELAVLAQLKKKTLADQTKRATFLKRAIRNLAAQLKKLRSARDKARGAKRAKMNERMRPIVDRMDDYNAELKSLGEAIISTELDIGDLAKEAGEAAGTPDTEVEPGPTAGERTDDLVSLIDARERAGVIDSATAVAQRQQVREGALAGKLGTLTERERLAIMGDLKEATVNAAQEMAQLALEMASLRESVDKQNAIAGSIIGVELATAQRVIGDLVSNQLGVRVSNRAQMPGSGALSRL